jgi:hypothetical protein
MYAAILKNPTQNILYWHKKEVESLCYCYESKHNAYTQQLVILIPCHVWFYKSNRKPAIGSLLYTHSNAYTF